MTDQLRLDTQTVDGTLTPAKISTNPSDNFTFPGNVTITGSVSAASGTGGGSGAAIVATVELTGQTASIPLTTIFTPTVPGTYLVSAYLVASAGTGSDQATVKVSWTDDGGLQSQSTNNSFPLNVLTINLGAPGSADEAHDTIQSVAGQPIQYEVVYVPDNNSGVYSIYITVTQLVELGGGTSAEVAELTLENQTSVPAGIATLFTPTETGLYALKMYMVGTLVGAPGSSNIAIQFQFTDTVGIQLAQGQITLNQSGAFFNEDYVSPQTSSGFGTFYAVAGQPVQYSFDATINAGGSPMTLVNGDMFSIYLKVFKADTASGAVPSGPDRSIQFNNAGAFKGTNSFKLDPYGNVTFYADVEQPGADFTLAGDGGHRLAFTDASGATLRGAVGVYGDGTHVQNLENLPVIINAGVGPAWSFNIDGSLTVAGLINSVTDPVNPQDAATKNYVDSNGMVPGTSATGTVVVVDYTALSGATFTVAGHTLTEGVEWFATSDNNTTAISLRNAINTLKEVYAVRIWSYPPGFSNNLSISAFQVEGSNSIDLATSDAVNLTISGSTLTGEVDPGNKTFGSGNSGGSLVLTTDGGGSAVSVVRVGGGITLTTGSSSAGGVHNFGGGLTLTTGDLTGSPVDNNATGGSILLTTGTCGHTFTYTAPKLVGGSITLTTGYAGDATGTETGGSITLTAYTPSRGGNLLLTGTAASRGQVGIGTAAPDASASLDIVSTTRGVLFPRMTQTQRDNIASPAVGLMLWNLDSNKLQAWDGSSWQDAW